MAGRSGDEQPNDFCWECLIARLLHPIQVGIIEALRWLETPLSVRDLERIGAGTRLAWHLERLGELDVVRRSAQAGHARYELVAEPGT
jgi:hypothetical protein